MDSKIVFDINQAGYHSWWFPASGLIFFVIGAVLALINRARAKRNASAISDRSGTRAPFLPWLCMGFSLLWSLGTFASTYGDYRNLRDAFNQGQCQVVEGPVEHFHAGSGNRGDASDSFEVRGTPFTCSGSVEAGFGQIQSEGSPLREGLLVRISAYQGQIAKLEILQ